MLATRLPTIPIGEPRGCRYNLAVRKLADILREQQRDDPRDLRSRSDARRERRQSEDHLADLARRLTALKPRQLERLALPDTLLDAVLEARKITSPAAHARQLRIVRREIRAVDAQQLERALEDLSNPRRPAPPGGEAARWVGELVDGGDEALRRFLEQYPRCDRQHLRQLVRAVRRKRDSAGESRPSTQLVAEVSRVVSEHESEDDATTE